MKLYETTITEQTGDKTYYFDIYIGAEDQEEAEEVAHEYASRWYRDEDAFEIEPNHWDGLFLPEWWLGEVREVDVLWKSIETSEGHFYLRLPSWDIVKSTERWPALEYAHEEVIS